MKTKTILLTISTCIVLVFGLLYFTGRYFVFTEKEKADNAKMVLVLDYGDGQQKFRVLEKDGNRAWNILQQVAAIAKIDLKPTNDFRPQKISGKTNGDGDKVWVFYINGVKQETSPYEVFVRPPAEVAFRFE